ncbi:unnamed protein product [Echinostoma caproni]|uniref:RING-type E3 ubiquitin transferase n=1 Tax=Echinostoma caproni TaxID=27848 RepID=A0A183ATD1_9TREM|nr:unnamed protein product [Echinostoma caproni]
MAGLLRCARRSVLDWLHLTMVCLAWLIVVPLTACRIYRCLFTGSVSSLLTLPLDMLSTRHLLQDCLQGFTIVILASAAFLGYISLREQLLQGGGPAWLEQDAVAGNVHGHESTSSRFYLSPTALKQDTSIVELEEDLRDGGVNGRRHVFPDLFNLFGAANGAPGAAEAPGPDAPAADVAQRVDPDVGTTAATTASVSGETANATSDHLNETTSSASSSLGTTSGTHTNPEERALQPQQMGWRADGLAFCPYHLGHFTVIGFKLEKLVAITHMEGLSIGIIGYLIFAGALVFFHSIFRLMGMPNACYWTGLCYVYIKVALVSLLELGIFPVLCGLWIDTCTLSLFNSTLTQRAAVLHHAPLAFTFIHWAMGMLYLFYMASLLILARSVVRPGVLRFVYHFNDPDFKPVQDVSYCLDSADYSPTLSAPRLARVFISSNYSKSH